MVILFAATGHINYAKSSRLYLQLILELPTEHPWLYECFIKQGCHVYAEVADIGQDCGLILLLSK